MRQGAPRAPQIGLVHNPEHQCYQHHGHAESGNPIARDEDRVKEIEVGVPKSRELAVSCGEQHRCRRDHKLTQYKSRDDGVFALAFYFGAVNRPKNKGVGQQTCQAAHQRCGNHRQWRWQTHLRDGEIGTVAAEHREFAMGKVHDAQHTEH